MQLADCFQFSYLLRRSEETFQREIMCGMLTAFSGDCLLWNTERTISRIYIPVLLNTSMADKGCRDLLKKVRGRNCAQVAR